MRKKILFILPNLEAGGAERIITILSSHINQEKFDPVLVLFEKKGVYLEQLNPKVRIIEMNIKRIRFSIFKMIPILRKEKPEIVFSGWGEISALMSILIPFYPKIKFVTRETNVVSKHVTRKEIRFFYRFYNNYKTIIAQSDDMREDLIKNIGIHPNKITKINNPVDFQLINQKRKELREVNFPKPNFKQVIAVGNVSYRKGFDNLLKVFSHLKKESIFLNILGDGAQMEEFQNLAKELGVENVKFWGIQRNPFVFLEKADLFVLSSRYEGFPNVLLEAGACGTFSLANDCKGGINEIVTPVNGRISDIENHKEFAIALKGCLSMNHDKRRIQESIKNRYDKSLILEQYFRLLESL